MNKGRIIFAGMVPGLMALGLISTAVMAQDPIVYPNQGQSAEQQQQDEFQCHQWARDRTGFDPMAMPTATSAPPSRGSQGVGALGGAATGAVVGGILGGSSSAKRGALAGGALGGIRRGNQKRQDRNRQQQWEQDQARHFVNARGEFNRAFSACMDGRGYTVR